MSTINFLSADMPTGLDKPEYYKNLIKQIFISENFKLKKVSFIFCSDNYLLVINKKYLHHNYYTDIISFLLSLPLKPIEAEVYISIERVYENAKKYKVSYQNELLRVIIHGVLHLCGYNDKLFKEKKLMRKLENAYIQFYYNSHET